VHSVCSVVNVKLMHDAQPAARGSASGVSFYGTIDV